MASHILAILRAIAILLLFIMGFLLVIPTGAWFWPRNRLVSAIKVMCMKVALKVLGLSVSVEGSAPLSGANDQNTLWVSNHISWTDVNVLNSLGQVTFLSKAEVRSWPIVGPLAHIAGTLFVERGSGKSKEVAQDVANVLDNEQSVVLFPEATTSDGIKIRRFFHPIFNASVPNRHPIQPITLRYTRNGHRCPLSPFIDDDIFGTHLWRLLHLRGITVKVTFHPTIQPSEYDTAKTLANQAHHVIEQPLLID